MDVSKIKIEQSFEIINKDDTLEKIWAKTVKVVPSERQLKWQQLELTAFFHYGMNTYSDVEWGKKGTLASEFKGSEMLDADQWIKTVKDAGFTAAIITAKHHDGFCLWPTKFSDYSVKNAPYKDGKGDIVGDFAAACKKYNVKFGVYLSPWDMNDQRYGDSLAYDQYYRDQLTELLTNYGEVYDVWFDGACSVGPNGKIQKYDWRSYFDLIRELAPDATISITGPDVRWVGNEGGRGREAEWSAIPYGKLEAKEGENSFITGGGDLMQADIGSDEVLLAKAKEEAIVFWSPAQVDVSIRPGWFYHKMEDTAVLSLDKLIKIYYSSVGGNAQLLLNLPPNRDGLVHDADIKRLQEFHQFLERTFTINIAENAKITMSKDGKDFVHTIKLNEPKTFNLITLMEDITQGQRTDTFIVKAKIDKKLVNIANARTIGYKKILPIDKITTDEVVIITTKYRADPIYSFIGLYYAPTVNSAPKITRDDDAKVVITGTSPLAKIFYSINNDKVDIEYKEPFEFKDSGTIYAIAKTEEENLFSKEKVVVKQTFGVFMENWKLVSYTGENANKDEYNLDNITRFGANIIALSGTAQPEVVLDMQKQISAKGFIYVPVTHVYDFEYNLLEYEVYLSDDNINFTLAAKGRFDNMRNNPVLQQVMFEHVYSGRYLKLKAVQGFGENKVSFGKISLISNN